MVNLDGPLLEADQNALAEWMANDLVTDSVAGFVEGPGIRKLELQFDISELRTALDQVLARDEFAGDRGAGFGIIPLTRRPGTTAASDNELSGLYWIRADERYAEEPMEEVVDEAAFSEFIPDFADTYFAHVHDELTRRVPIGRMRVLWKGLYNGIVSLSVSSTAERVRRLLDGGVLDRFDIRLIAGRWAGRSTPASRCSSNHRRTSMPWMRHCARPSV